MIEDHPSSQSVLAKPRFWFRVIGLGIIVVVLGFVFLRFHPTARRITCRSFETVSTDPTGRNIATVTFSCLSIYWYYIAGFAGAALAAFITLRKTTMIRLALFIIVCDLLVTWIAGSAVLVWDRLQPHTIPGPGPLAFWAGLPFTGLLLGVTFGNIFTLGFPAWAAALALLCILGGERVFRLKR